MNPEKINFFDSLSWGATFLISGDNKETNIWHSLGVPPSRGPLNEQLKYQFF